MEEAGRVVEQIQAPVGSFVEDLGDRRLVLEDLSAREEVLVLLHSYHPEVVGFSALIAALDRRKEKTVRNTLNSLWQERLLEGRPESGYRLTLKGVKEAIEIVVQRLDSTES